MRRRHCNRVRPSQLKLDGLSHIYFAFAEIDPHTFEIVPRYPGDEELYYEFTARRFGYGSPQTWIAIGGFDFSDPGTPTHTTWYVLQTFGLAHFVDVTQERYGLDEAEPCGIHQFAN